MTLKNFLSKQFKSTRNLFYQPNKNAILLLGMDKSGTSATINLIAKSAGITFVDDPTYKLKGFDEVLNGETTLENYLNDYSYYYSRNMMRFPAEPKAVKLASGFFTMNHILMTIRNPISNIKSILSRLNLPGNLRKLDTSKLNFHPSWMELLTRKENYIESIASRWNEIYTQDLFQINQNFVKFKYEDFLEDKVSYIENKVVDLGLKPTNDIHHLVDVQFQPKGTNISSLEFFGKENFDKIIELTSDTAKRFGYDF